MLQSVRTAVPRVGYRLYASAVSHGHGHSGEVQERKMHPCFNAHPVAPVVTYDDWPVPCVPYKESYEKNQKTFNAMLAASTIAFLATSFYVWWYDYLSLRLTGPPSWWTKRKIGKGLGDID